VGANNVILRDEWTYISSLKGFISRRKFIETTTKDVVGCEQEKALQFYDAFVKHGEIPE